MAVTVGNSRFFNLEQAHFHSSLRGAVVICSGTLNQVSLLTHPVKQALLTNRMAVLLQNLGQVANQNRAVRRAHRIRKQHLRFRRCHIAFQLLNALVTLPDSALRYQHSLRHNLCVRHVLTACDVTAGLSDCRNDFACHPALEFLCFGHLAGEDERVKTAFVDYVHSKV